MVKPFVLQNGFEKAIMKGKEGGRMYRTANEYYKEKYGEKVYKLSLDGGFTCPNRDGSVSTGGCIFCSALGGGEFAEHGTDITVQLEKAKKRVADKIKDGKYIAYFQSFTNTYGPTQKLEKLYRAAIAPDFIVGLNIATRPDCLPEETIRLLAEINAIKPVTVELGLQTAEDTVADYINRGYPTAVYADALSKIYRLPVKAALLYFFTPGKFVTVI